jgi:hypothetical protein
MCLSSAARKGRLAPAAYGPDGINPSAT